MRWSMTSVMLFGSPFFLRYSTAKAICVLTSAPYPVSWGCEKGTSGARSRFLLAVGVVLSDAADGEGEGGASDVALPALVLDGFESFAAAEARVPRKADDCFSRYEDMVGEEWTGLEDGKSGGDSRGMFAGWATGYKGPWEGRKVRQVCW